MILKWTGLSAGILYARSERALAISTSSSPTTSTLTLIASPASTLASMRASFSACSREIVASSKWSGISVGLMRAIHHLWRFQQHGRGGGPRLNRALAELSKKGVDLVILHRRQRGFQIDRFRQH